MHLWATSKQYYDDKWRKIMETVQKLVPYIFAYKSHFWGQLLSLKQGVQLIWGTGLYCKSMDSNPEKLGWVYGCDSYASVAYMWRYMVVSGKTIDMTSLAGWLQEKQKMEFAKGSSK